MERPLVPREIGRVRFDLAKTTWLWGMLVPGATLGVVWLTPRTAFAALALTFLTLCVGHSVGLHRGIIHQAYATHPLTRATLAYLFVLSGLGGPLSWARLHAVRDYWQNRADCPRYFAYDHSLAEDFAWNLHGRFEPADDRADARLPPGVLEDRWLLFLERTWPLHVLALAVVAGLAFGPGCIFVCISARVAASILGHWFIGYAAHTWGDRPFVVPGAKESGTNVWLLGVLSFGEGFHNNHHAFPRSARMGISPGQPDLGWWIITILARLGCVWDLTSVSPPRGAGE